MYLWNVEELNKDLKKGLTEKEDFKYLLAYIILGLTVLFIPVELTFYEIIVSTITVIGTIIGFILFYKINGGEKGKNLLSRYFSIGLITFVRSIVFMLLPLMISFGVVMGIMYGENMPLEPTILDVSFTFIYMIGFIYLNLKYLKNLVQK